MAALTKQYTFAAATTIESAKVNTNFDDIVAHINGSLVHKDGSVTMTGALTLPASDPASDNVASRKAYSDKFLKCPNISLAAPVVGSAINPQTTRGVFWQGGSNVITTAGDGGFTIPYPTAFASRVITVVACPGDQVLTPIEVSFLHSNQTLSQANGIIRYSTTGAAVAAGNIRLNWVAVGL